VSVLLLTGCFSCASTLEGPGGPARLADPRLFRALFTRFEMGMQPGLADHRGSERAQECPGLLRPTIFRFRWEHRTLAGVLNWGTLPADAGY
jgi:hypothetical protein